MASFVDDPLGFVYFAFPWGEGLLKDEEGPDDWQARLLHEIGERCLATTDALQIAVASGHGIGKGTLAAWIMLWFMSTRPHPQIVATANTSTQLEKKTWRELAKWHKLAIHSHWFEWTATTFKLKGEAETWFANAVAWSQHNAQAFAGTHERHVLMVFDEASEIPGVIWETADGAMTTEGAMWLALGNPTQANGRFRECFSGGKFAHRWLSYQIDARTAKQTNKAKLKQWEDDYGDDSDFFRVRVKGQFPKTSGDNFISEGLLELACARQAPGYEWAPIIVGVDVGRTRDRSVMTIRQGNRILERVVLFPHDVVANPSVVIGNKLAQVIQAYQPRAVFVDAVGIGVGVVDYMPVLGYKVIGVQSAQTQGIHPRWLNMRAQMWGLMREWLRDSGCLDRTRDATLLGELKRPKQLFRGDREWLTPKDELEAVEEYEGFDSPDEADSLALTFASPVAPLPPLGAQPRRPAQVDWNVMTYDHARV